MNKLVVTDRLQDSPSLGSRASHRSFLKSASYSDFKKEEKRFLQRVDIASRGCQETSKNYISIQSLPSALKGMYIHSVWTLKSVTACDRTPAVEVK